MDKLISKKFSEFQYKYIADPDYKKEYDNNLKALHRIRLRLGKVCRSCM
uniref:Uncharacterized protein n=1 Tax=Iridovirus sp. TaxID=135728 RepID=A0AAU7YE58_9VIRU